MQYPILVREEPSGQFTAQAVGIPEARVTAATKKAALDQVQAMLTKWVESGELTTVELPEPNLLLQWAGWVDPNDPLEQEYLEELARMKREDLEQTLRELDQECPDSSSTPTT